MFEFNNFKFFAVLSINQFSNVLGLESKHIHLFHLQLGSSDADLHKKIVICFSFFF